MGYSVPCRVLKSTHESRPYDGAEQLGMSKELAQDHRAVTALIETRTSIFSALQVWRSINLTDVPQEERLSSVTFSHIGLHVYMACISPHA